MSIPSYDQVIHPLLRILVLHPGGIRSRDAYEAVADAMGISEDERRVLLPSGRQAVYKNRVGWANDRLKRAGHSHCPQRGLWCATESGRSLLEVSPDGFDKPTLRSLWRVPVSDASDSGVSPEMPRSPVERVHAAVGELNESLSAQLLELVCECSPAFFEQLVLHVLHAMGYGASEEDLEQTPLSADGGIDGIISLDRLGLQNVYVQAKRWTQGVVTRPEIQKFFGALAGRGASRGVFITTSTFSSGARTYAQQVPGRIVLVDGKQLASLMIEYEVGVTVQDAVKLCRVDHDYFEET